MTIRELHRAVGLVGLLGSFVFVFLGTWLLVSRVWAASFTQTLEVLVAAPFLAIWVLAPFFWAAWPRSEPPPSRWDMLISLATAGLLVSVAAFAYSYEFLVRPWVFDQQPGRSSLIVVLIIPGLQWAIAGVAVGIRAIRRRPPIGGRPGG